MEFTVTKSDLVRELGLSQGVVERKTTIPILSNVLLEVSGDRLNLTATDLELGFRCSTPAPQEHRDGTRARRRGRPAALSGAAAARALSTPRRELRSENFCWIAGSVARPCSSVHIFFRKLNSSVIVLQFSAADASFELGH